MKTLIFPLMLALLLMCGTVNAQQNQINDIKNNVKHDAKSSFTFASKPAMVSGSMATVTFGTEPRVIVKRVMEDNVPIIFDRQHYYYNKGDYYSYNGGRYILISPPAGLSINVLPKQNFRLRYEDEWLHYYNGIFYRPVQNQFEVIKAPQGAIIYDLPLLTDVVVINNEAYYEYLGVLYKKVFVDNEQGFEVVGELTE